MCSDRKETCPWNQKKKPFVLLEGMFRILFRDYGSMKLSCAEGWGDTKIDEFHVCDERNALNLIQDPDLPEAILISLKSFFIAEQFKIKIDLKWTFVFSSRRNVYMVIGMVQILSFQWRNLNIKVW